jgi:hypothetical protein
MQVSDDKLRGETAESVPLPADSQPGSVNVDEGLDLSLLEDTLAKKPWERMQANDDALRFAETLRTAMKRLESQRTDAETY